MFIMSKRNFLVRRADGTSFLIKKDFVGDIPKDIAKSTVVTGAIKGGLIVVPSSHKDKDMHKAADEAKKTEDKADIRNQDVPADAAPEQADKDDKPADEEAAGDKTTESKAADGSKK